MHGIREYGTTIIFWGSFTVSKESSSGFENSIFSSEGKASPESLKLVHDVRGALTLSQKYQRFVSMGLEASLASPIGERSPWRGSEFGVWHCIGKARGPLETEE